MAAEGPRPRDTGAGAGGLVSPAMFRDLLRVNYDRRRETGGLLAVLLVQLDGVAVTDPTGDVAVDGQYFDELEALCRAAGDDGVVAPAGAGGFLVLLDSVLAPHHAANLS